MNDLEISKALALAIGWHQSELQITKSGVYCLVWNSTKTSRWYKLFDYRDWNVIGPIAAKYDCFPYSWYHNAGTPCWRSSTDTHEVNADTPQKAIALAVIQGAKK